MAVTGTEASRWTAVGTKDAAQATYARVEQALEQSTRLRCRLFETFLQGSYRNATNLRGDSDVDVVAMLTDAYTAGLELLTPSEEAAWRAQRTPPAYGADEFRADVSAALRDSFGGAVHEKDKCLRVDKSVGFVDADVVPCLRYLLYRRFPTRTLGDSVEGIIIFPRSGGRIVNFPKEHIRNGQEKNKRCLERYKPTVRQVKHLRNRAESQGLLADGVAPGYLLECLVYNVEDRYFLGDDLERLAVVLDYLAMADFGTFMSCDGIHTLFGTDPGGFSVDTAGDVVRALRTTLRA